MELSNIYYQRFLGLLLDEYNQELEQAKSGHCMKITGLALQELRILLKMIKDRFPDIQVFILSESGNDDISITATKLIELRNELAMPLLVLIPSNSRTSTEDSYGNATFKNLDISHLNGKLLSNLKHNIPAASKSSLTEIFEYLKIQKIEPIQYIHFLLDVETNNYSPESIGNALYHLALIPDSKLIKEYAQIRQRLMFNLKCIEILGDFSQTISDRIAELQIEAKTIQPEIARFFKTEPYLKNKLEICRKLAENYSNLNFAYWPIPDIENNREIVVAVDSMSSKNFEVKDGDYKLTIVPGKTAKITLTITTNPAPKDFKDLKSFRIVLWAIDGWSQVLDVKIAKVTESPKNYRKVTIELSENVVEEGTYFFRVFAEDENGVILNTQDAFRNLSVEDLFKQQQELTREEFQYRHQVKYSSDSEDFYIDFDEIINSGENIQRKDKLDNALQAFFKYRIEQLRTNREPDIPKPINESGVFLKDFHNSLQGTYYLKYSSNHNYQINISKKLYELEHCFLKHAGSLGRIEAVLGGNPTDTEYQSLQFIPFEANHLIPESLLKLRFHLYDAIQKSTPASDGVFETYDLFNHIDLLRDYIVSFEQWTRSLKNNLSNHSIENEEQQHEIRKALIEIQNIDIVTVQTKLPDGKDISVKLISPLHPLRLAWFLNLFDLFTEWENKTRENASYRWSKNLDKIFWGDVIPESGVLVLADIFNSEYYQYSGELTFSWGLYTKSELKEDATFASNSRQIKIYLSTLLNISNEYRIDADVNQMLIIRHLKNYITQHPYTETLVINLFNVGDGYAFTNALIELEKQSEFKKLKYELRLFSEDDVIQPGEALRYLLNPESNIISEEAEVFSQPSKNRLFPKLRFSINKVTDFINHAKEYGAHLSFLINPFPVKTTLVRPAANRKSFFFHSLVNKQVVLVSERGNNISWNKYYSENYAEEDFVNTTVSLFANMQAFVANAIAVGNTQSVPAINLELKEQDKFLLSFIHDVSDWVITFDKNMGPEIFDLPCKTGEIPFLLDFIPGQELSGISSYLTTRPTSEIIGLLGPHFAKFGIDLRTDEDTLKILLEDLRTVSSSLILQLNTSENKAFEVLGTAFTKRVLDKKGILENAFLIPIDLHKDLFEQLPGENKKRADNLLVNINPEKRTVTFSVIEIKCRTSIGESERFHLLETMQAQIANTIEALIFHFDITYQNPDRLDRELKTLELKLLLEFYINRATRYNQLLPQTQQIYLDFLESLDEGYDIQYKKLGIIYDFSQEKPQLKEVFDNNTTFFTFGKRVISDILDPDSDLNTSRLEGHKDDIEFQNFFNKREISPYVENILSGSNFVEEPVEPYITLVNKGVSEDNKYENKKEENRIHPEEREVPVTATPSESQAKDLLAPAYDIMVGKSTDSGQYGILGKVSANKKVVALDLIETNTISLFGVQGAGKSYTIGTISEMVLKQFDKVNYLPGALAGVIFHYSESMDYAPEFTSMIYKNDKLSELQKLKNEYGAEPSSIEDVVLLTPRDKVEERKTEYPSVNVYPISFNSNEINVQDWMFLLGAIGNDSTYIKQLKAIMRSMRTNITLDRLKNSVASSSLLSNSQKMLAEQRIQFASEYIDDDFKLRDLLRPGRLIIVDLRDEFIEKDEALGLFVVMLNIFSSKKTIDNQSFNKFIVFDEAHKYMDNKDLTRSIVTAIREMRHKGVSIMIASQDPPSLPNEIIELSSVVLLHKFNSPQWLKHIQKSVAQLASLTPADLSSLNPGEAFLWATKSTDKPLTNRPIKISTRPRVTKHGGDTIKAI